MGTIAKKDMLLRVWITQSRLQNVAIRQYVQNPATHIDFLLYNRINKKPILAIEVDGFRYHKADTAQAERDLLKNHILDLYGIPLLRFQTNGSGEREQMIKTLDEIIG